MADVDLDRLEALAKEATPGPWLAYPNANHRPIGSEAPHYVAHRDADLACVYTGGGRAPRNAAFIAAADPATVLALIAQVRAARGEPTPVDLIGQLLVALGQGDHARPDTPQQVWEAALAQVRADHEAAEMWRHGFVRSRGPLEDSSPGTEPRGHHPSP